MGSWLWTLRSESAAVILKDYFQKSVAIYSKQLEAAEAKKDVHAAKQIMEDMSTTYEKLASFCDEQHSHIRKYMNSKEFEDKKDILQQIAQDHENL